MESTKYIHYGHSSFDLFRFTPIQNREMFSKPSGGLWASAVDSEYGWKEWCTDENFRMSNLSESFEFVLTEWAKVLHIRSVKDLESLPRHETPGWYGELMWDCLDFEILLSQGWDAIELHLSEEDLSQVGFCEGLYYKLYGWDCDSILIMNPYVVVEDI